MIHRSDDFLCDAILQVISDRNRELNNHRVEVSSSSSSSSEELQLQAAHAQLASQTQTIDQLQRDLSDAQLALKQTKASEVSNSIGVDYLCEA